MGFMWDPYVRVFIIFTFLTAEEGVTLTGSIDDVVAPVESDKVMSTGKSRNLMSIPFCCNGTTYQCLVVSSGEISYVHLELALHDKQVTMARPIKLVMFDGAYEAAERAVEVFLSPTIGGVRFPPVKSVVYVPAADHQLIAEYPCLKEYKPIVVWVKKTVKSRSPVRYRWWTPLRERRGRT